MTQPDLFSSTDCVTIQHPWGEHDRFTVAAPGWLQEIVKLYAVYGENELDHLGWMMAISIGREIYARGDYGMVVAQRGTLSGASISLDGLSVPMPIAAGEWVGPAMADFEQQRMNVRTGVAKALRSVSLYVDYPFGRDYPTPKQAKLMDDIDEYLRIPAPIQARLSMKAATGFCGQHLEALRIARAEYGPYTV